MMERERERRERPSPFDERPKTFAPLLRPKVDETPRDALRAQWPLLLPVPLVLVAAWVLTTSERVWTEALIRTYSRSGQLTITSLGAHARTTIVIACVAYVVMPLLLAWLVRAHRGATDATVDTPTLGSRLAEWLPRLLLLVFIAHRALWLLREA